MWREETKCYSITRLKFQFVNNRMHRDYDTALGSVCQTKEDMTLADC